MPTMKEVTDLLAVVLPSVTALIPIVVKVWRERRPATQRSQRRRPWLQTLGLSITAGLIVYLLTTAISRNLLSPEAPRKDTAAQTNSTEPLAVTPTISRPIVGTPFDCDSEDKQGNCVYRVEGKLSAPLGTGVRLYVAVKEMGGDEWWITGGAVDVFADRTWSQPNASFGSKDSKIKEYIIGILLTTEEIPPNSHLRTLPSNVAYFRVIRK